MTLLRQQITRLWRGSLRRQIVIPAILVTLLFLSALGFVAFRIGQRAVAAQVEARNRQIATEVSLEVGTYFQSLIDTLRLQGEQLRDSTNPARQSAALVALRSRFPYTYNDLRVVDQSGRATMVLTGTLAKALDRGAVGVDSLDSLSRDPSVQEALQQERITIAPVAFRPITNVPYVTMTLPLERCLPQQSCVPSGALVAQVDLRTFWTKVDSIRLDGGSVGIVDRKGVILAHPDRQRVGTVIDQRAIAPVFGGFEGTTTYEQAGVTYLAAYAPVGRVLGWGVIVAQEQDAALAGVRTIGQVAAFVTLLSAVSLALLLSTIVRRAVQPVTALSTAAAAIASSGDLSSGQLVLAAPSDEIEVLSDSFNHMVAGLRMAQERLQRWNEDLEQRVAERTAQLHTVLDVARLSNGTLQQQEVQHTVLEHLERVVAYDSASIMLLDGTGTALVSVTTAGAKAVRRTVRTLSEYQLNQQVVENRSSLLVPSTRANPDWVPWDERNLDGSWLGVPLLVQNRAIGVLGLYKEQPDFYSEDDASLVMALASQVAIALDHARLYEESVQRVERELRMAEQVQRHLFPLQPPAVTGLSVAAFYRPAHETTGDFYEFVTPGAPDRPISNGTGSTDWGHLGVIMGDVSGKSLPAAILMAIARTALRSAAHTTPFDPAIILRSVNTLLLGEMPRGSFVAGSYAVFNHLGGVCDLVNAGQPAPLLVRDGCTTLLEGEGSHLPLGIVAAPAYQVTHIPIQPGDLLVFYTDGVIEAFNQERELFGFERLEAVLATCSSSTISPETAITSIIDAVTAWTGDTPQHDDIALVAVRVAGT